MRCSRSRNQKTRTDPGNYGMVIQAGGKKSTEQASIGVIRLI